MNEFESTTSDPERTKRSSKSNNAVKLIQVTLSPWATDELYRQKILYEQRLMAEARSGAETHELEKRDIEKAAARLLPSSEDAPSLVSDYVKRTGFLLAGIAVTLGIRVLPDLKSANFFDVSALFMASILGFGLVMFAIASDIAVVKRRHASKSLVKEISPPASRS